jgi:F-type H+-transporting ATPase subunit b
MMSTFAKFGALRIAAILAAMLVAAGPIVAQNVAEEAHEAAAKSAHETEAAHHGGPGGPNPLAIDPDLAIWTAVVFVLLFIILRLFAWPQIAAALDERERKITDNIAAAEARLEEAKRVLAQHEAKLAAAAGEVRALLEEAHRDADHTRRSIEEKGRQAAKEELDRAIREINRARDGAIEELAGASANVAIDLASKVIRGKLTPDEQSKIVKDALGKLSAATPSKN